MTKIENSKEIVLVPIHIFPSDPKHLFIKSAGLNDGKWGITLSDGSVLDGVEEILQTKPAYSDGFVVTAKIFIPFKDKSITKGL